MIEQILSANFVKNNLKGGVCRVKQNLAGGYRNGPLCPKAPPDIKVEIKKFMSEKKKSWARKQFWHRIKIFMMWLV